MTDKAGELSSFIRVSPILEKGTEDAELSRILECPVCRELPFPPIFTCTEGHTVCSDCRPKLTQCGLCKHALSVKRNYPLEAIVLSSRYTCPYRQYGCGNSIKGDNYRAHLLVCNFRPIQCFQAHVISCKGTNLNYDEQEILKHLKTVHKIYISSSDRGYYPTSEWANDLASGGTIMSMCLKFDGKHFFKNSHTYNYSRYWWISILGSEEDAQDYHARIILTKTKDSKVPKMEWIIPVHSFRKSFREVLENGFYASVSPNSLKNFCLRDQKKDGSVYNYTWSTQLYLEKNGTQEKSYPQVTRI